MAKYNVEQLAKKVYQEAGKGKLLGNLMELRTGLPPAKSEDTDDAPILVRDVLLAMIEEKSLIPKLEGGTTQRRNWKKYVDGSLFDADMSETAYESAWESLLELTFQVGQVKPKFPLTLEVAVGGESEAEEAETAEVEEEVKPKAKAKTAAKKTKPASALEPTKARVKTPAAQVAKNSKKK